MPGYNFSPYTTNNYEKPIEPESGMVVDPEGEEVKTLPGFDMNQEDKNKDGQEYAKLRFLNAATSMLSVNILIDNRVFYSALEFGKVTQYGKVEDGFHQVAVVSSANPRLLFYQKTIPFVKGEAVTLVIIDDTNDLDLVLVSEKGTENLPEGSGSFRAANMSFDYPDYDVVYYSGDVIFSNIRFKDVTFFKEAKQGRYELFISKSVTGTERTEVSILEPADLSAQPGFKQPLYWFTVNVKPGHKYTAYIIGNNWSLEPLRVLVLES